MARYWFGGGIADWTFTTVDGVGGVDDVAQVVGGATITVWNAETGGTQYTDLLDDAGATVQFLTSADGTTGRPVGQIPPFQGPDGVTEVWASADGGSRARMFAPSLEAALAPFAVMARQRSSSAHLPPQSTPTVMTTFRPDHGWTSANAGAATNVNDNADFVMGTQAAKLVTNTTATASTLDSPTTTTYNLTGMMPRLLIKVEGLANVSSLRFFAGDSTFANFRNWNLGPVEANPLANFIKEGEWQWVTFNWTHASLTGTDPRASVSRFRLSATGPAAGSFTVHLQAVTFVPEQSRWPNGVVSVCFDDGRASPLVNAKPKLDTLGWAASAYPIVDKIGQPTYATVAQLKEARDFSGWEMGVHASTGARHDAGLTALTPDELEQEIATCQEWLAANGLGVGEGIAWPLGWSTKAHEEAAARFCAYGRGNVSSVRETWLPPLPMRIRSIAVSPSSSLALIQGYVDEAKNNRAWLSLTFHEITTPGTGPLEWPTANFSSLMDYIKAAGCAVLPVGHVLRNAGTTS